MKVTIDSWTPNPMEVISRAAGVCYRKRDSKHSRVHTCMDLGHLSVFEHASVTFRIEGVSRACSHQLVRHRMASFCQESQRYCKYDLSGDDWYVKPPAFDSSGKYFDKCMRDAAAHYLVNIRGGMKPEDARYLLPEATKTILVMTMNWRELYHFWDLRTSSNAQWEIRNMARNMIEVCRENEDTAPMAELWEQDTVCMSCV